MADFNCKGTVDGSEPAARELAVASGGAATIDIGDIVVVANGYAAKMADAGGGAGNLLTGLATSISTDTAGADGVVQVKFSPAGLVVEGLSTTAANLTTAVMFDKVTLDVASGVQKIDENDAGALLIWKYPTSTPTTDGKVQVVLPWTLAS